MIDRLRRANPVPTPTAVGDAELYARIVAAPRRPERRRRRPVLALAAVVLALVPVGAAATALFDPLDAFRAGGAHRIDWSDHPALGGARIEAGTTRRALTRPLPDGRRVEIWTARLGGGAGACVGTRLAGEPELLPTATAPCGPYRARIDPGRNTLRRSGFEDSQFADVDGYRVVFGLLSPELARRAAEVRVAGQPAELRVTAATRRAPARGVYAVVLSRFDPMNDSWPALEALDARGRVIALLPGACRRPRC